MEGQTEEVVPTEVPQTHNDSLPSLSERALRAIDNICDSYETLIEELDPQKADQDQEDPPPIRQETYEKMREFTRISAENYGEDVERLRALIESDPGLKASVERSDKASEAIWRNFDRKYLGKEEELDLDAAKDTISRLHEKFQTLVSALIDEANNAEEYNPNDPLPGEEQERPYDEERAERIAKTTSEILDRFEKK